METAQVEWGIGIPSRVGVVMTMGLRTKADVFAETSGLSRTLVSKHSPSNQVAFKVWGFCVENEGHANSTEAIHR
jgi:hypothetical protein